MKRKKATINFYLLTLADRRRLLIEAGFVRDGHAVWRHPDGRAAGESVLRALADSAFRRYVEGAGEEKR